MNEQMMGGPQETITLTIGDVATVVQVIDVVTRRGGFQGNELASVGMLRNKLEAYVNQNAPQQAPDANQEVDVAMPADGPDGPLADKVVS
jgi:hypothetical protein